MSDETEIVTHEDGDLYRVAVVVFTNVRAEGDYTDAAFLATRAVARTLREHGVVFRQERQSHDGSKQLVWEVPVDVAEVMSLDMAAGNGHLTVTPSIRPYRTYGNAAGKLPESMCRPYDPAEDDY